MKNVYYDLVLPIAIPMSPSHPTYDPKIAAEWDYDLAAAAEFVKKSGIRNPSFELRAGTNDPDGQKIAQIVKGDLAKIGITANISLLDPTTMVNDAIAGNFQANVYGCSTGAIDVQDFEDCSVFRPNKGPFSGDKTFPNYKKAYYAAAATVEPQARIEAFKTVFATLQETPGRYRFACAACSAANRANLRRRLRREDSPGLSGDREVIAGGQW